MSQIKGKIIYFFVVIWFRETRLKWLSLMNFTVLVTLQCRLVTLTDVRRYFVTTLMPDTANLVTSRLVWYILGLLSERKLRAWANYALCSTLVAQISSDRLRIDLLNVMLFGFRLVRKLFYKPFFFFFALSLSIQKLLRGANRNSVHIYKIINDFRGEHIHLDKWNEIYPN